MILDIWCKYLILQYKSIVRIKLVTRKWSKKIWVPWMPLISKWNDIRRILNLRRNYFILVKLEWSKLKLMTKGFLFSDSSVANIYLIFIWKAKWQIQCPLVHSLYTCSSSQVWTRLKSGAQNSMVVSHR